MIINAGRLYFFHMLKINKNPTQTYLRILIAIICFLIFSLPSVVYSGIYQSSFSWDMFSGDNSSEKYIIKTQEATRYLTRAQIINNFNFKPWILPYGIHTLNSICNKDKNIIQIERYKKFSYSIICHP